MPSLPWLGDTDVYEALVFNMAQTNGKYGREMQVTGLLYMAKYDRNKLRWQVL
jgi:hypothetical protein